MANPRIDELRKRLEKEKESRLFAQLAEELRKDGDLEEAIKVCRDGLQRHPNYPSARMTLGRALFDTGDVAAARTEFEAVLKSAPDNILASRMLAESLESLGDLQAARGRYEQTLKMAPGDRAVKAKLEVLDKQVGAAAPQPVPPPPQVQPPAPQAARPPAPAPTPAAAPVFAAPPASPPEKPEEPAPGPVEFVEPPPIKLVDVDGPMELEKPWEAPPTAIGGGGGSAASRRSPTLRIDKPDFAAAEFELERPYDVPAPAFSPPDFQLPRSGAPAPLQEAERPPETPEFVDFDEAPTIPGTLGDFERSFETPPVKPSSRPVPSIVEFEEEPSPATLPMGFGTQAFLDARRKEPERVPAPEVPALEDKSDAHEAAAAPAAVGPSESAPGGGLELQFEDAGADIFEAAPEAGTALDEPMVEAQAAPPATAAEPVASMTLAELYFNQGLPEEAVSVLRRLLEREPGNEKARSRLAEIEGLLRPPVRPPARAPAGSDREARRQQLLGMIGRFEQMLAAVRKG